MMKFQIAWRGVRLNKKSLRFRIPPNDATCLVCFYRGTKQFHNQKQVTSIVLTHSQFNACSIMMHDIQLKSNLVRCCLGLTHVAVCIFHQSAANVLQGSSRYRR